MYIRRPKSETSGGENHIANKEENSDEHQLEDDSSWPIALHKGIQSYKIKYNILWDSIYHMIDWAIDIKNFWAP